MQVELTYRLFDISRLHSPVTVLMCSARIGDVEVVWIAIKIDKKILRKSNSLHTFLKRCVLVPCLLFLSLPSFAWCSLFTSIQLMFGRKTKALTYTVTYSSQKGAHLDLSSSSRIGEICHYGWRSACQTAARCSLPKWFVRDYHECRSYPIFCHVLRAGREATVHGWVWGQNTVNLTCLI